MRHAILVAALALASCVDEPRNLRLGFNSYWASPVVLTEVLLNGQPVGFMPEVVAGRADNGEPRFPGGIYSIDYPPGNGEVRVKASWVELLTRRAYAAEVSAPLDAFRRDEPDSIYIVPIFGPNGLLILMSDPHARSETDFDTNDVAQVCGTRTPEADTDFAARRNDYAGLEEALASDYPPVGAPVCPDPGG